MELGQRSQYETTYNPQRLFAIPRAHKRLDLGLTGAVPFVGHDTWNHFEVSWLNSRGKPQVGIAEMRYSCQSANIVESKSMKLYFNTFNNTRYESPEVLKEVIARDLTACVCAPVLVGLSLLETQRSVILSSIDGICVDDLDIAVDGFTMDPGQLATTDEIVNETLFSNLLKSNCLVTGQPDWASVWISYRGKKICREGLLRYIVSYRNHNEFHEHCVERIFMDVFRHCAPSTLTVGARYTRRGGIDINPVRSTNDVPVTNPRLIRQ